MKHTIISEEMKYQKIPYTEEVELTSIFEKHYKSIISPKSLWIRKEIKFRTGNFKDSINDGFIIVWENTTTPLLYLTEIELEKHSIDKHILPQIGDFISFVQKASKDDLNEVKSTLYKEIKNDKETFKKIQQETDREVHELIENALEDLQILLVIDRMSPELSIGLSQIEKAINIKIRKIEVSRFVGPKNEEVIFYTDSEEFLDEETETKEGIVEHAEEYTIEHHIKEKPEVIQDLFSQVMKFVDNRVNVIPTKHYIGFYNDIGMLFSLVIRRKSIIVYSKERIEKIETGHYKRISFRDVSSIGHYTNHLPTEIVFSEKAQVDEIKHYIDSLLSKNIVVPVDILHDASVERRGCAT